MAGEFYSENLRVSSSEYTYQDDEIVEERDNQLGLEMAKRLLYFNGNIILDKPETNAIDLVGYLKSSIVGQDEAIESIARALESSRLRIGENSTGPISTLAFLGPTGVGKTETAKEIAKFVATNGESRLIQIDCSVYSNGHEVANLIGSPPGYVGREQEPLLNKRDVEGGGAVILFDEIEKGSPKLYNLMLQIMGDGRLVLNNGSKVNFNEAIIILTSNLGAREMIRYMDKNPTGFNSIKQNPDSGAISNSALAAFSEYFSPEFIGRINSSIVFNSLSGEAMSKLADNKIDAINNKISKEHGIAVSLSDKANEYIVEKTLDGRSASARLLDNIIKEEILYTLKCYIDGDYLDTGTQLAVHHRSELPDEVHDQLPEGDLIFTRESEKDIYLLETYINHQRYLDDLKKMNERDASPGTQLIPFSDNDDDSSNDNDDKNNDDTK